MWLQMIGLSCQWLVTRVSFSGHIPQIFNMKRIIIVIGDLSMCEVLFDASLSFLLSCLNAVEHGIFSFFALENSGCQTI